MSMSKKVVRIITSMYENMMAKFSMRDLETGLASIKRGVGQRCVFYTIHFGLYVEELAVRVGNDMLSLLYADDVMVLSKKNQLITRDVEYDRDFHVRVNKEIS